MHFVPPPTLLPTITIIATPNNELHAGFLYTAKEVQKQQIMKEQIIGKIEYLYLTLDFKILRHKQTEDTTLVHKYSYMTSLTLVYIPINMVLSKKTYNNFKPK